MAAVTSHDISWAPAAHMFAVHQWSGLVALATSRGLVLFDAGSPQNPKHMIQFQTQRETSVMRFHPDPDSSLLATASENVLKVWNPLSPLRPAHLSAQAQFRILDVEWSVANANLLVTINAANQVEIWDVQSRANPVQSFTPDHDVIAVYPNPHADLLLCQGRDQLSLYDLKTLSPMTHLRVESHCFATSWDAAGEQFLTVHDDGFARLWNLDDLSVPRHAVAVPPLAKTIQSDQCVRLILAGSVAWVCASRQEQATNMVLISFPEDGPAADVMPQLVEEVIDIGLVRTGVYEGKATTVVAVSRGQKCYVADVMLGSTKRIQLSSARDIQTQASPKGSTTLRFQAPKKTLRNLKRSLAPPESEARAGAPYSSFAHRSSTNLTAANLWQEVLALDDLSRQHVLPGLTIEQFDEKARQVTFVMSLDAVQAATTPDSANKPLQTSSSSENTVSLIVVLPSHYPKKGLPTFNLRQGVGSITVSADSPLPNSLMLTTANKNALNHALLEVCQNELQKGLPYVKAVGQAFHKWIADFVYHSTNPTSPSQAAVTASQFQRDQSVEAAESAVIDALSYRVPCPRSSGARFSSSGMLVQFGRSATPDMPGLMSPVPESSGPKQAATRKRTTYADYLLHVRENAATETRSRAVSTASAFLLPSPDDSPLSSDKEDQSDDGSAYLEEKQAVPTRQRPDDDSGPRTNPYELYLDTPDVLLPISHPGHNFSIYDDDTPGLESKHGGDMGSSAQMRLSSWAHVEVQVLVVNLVALFKGQTQLAQEYSLGCMRPSTSAHRLSESKHCDLPSPKPRAHESGFGLYTLAPADVRGSRRRGVAESKADELALVPAPVLSAEGDACRENAEAAMRVQRPELARMWMTLATTFDAMYEDQRTNASSIPYHTLWKHGALGSKLLNKTFSYLEARGELQTLAVLICIMGGPKAAHALLGPPRTVLAYDRILLSYADVLMQWHALRARAEVIKRVHFQPQAQSSQELALSVKVTCQTCHRASAGQWCGYCKDFAFRCAICATAVRGTSLFCLSCGHGGHPKHIEQWFVDHPECPTGCGCRCVEVSFAHNADTDDDQTLESVLSHEDLQILPMGSDDSAGRRFHGKQVRFS